MNSFIVPACSGRAWEVPAGHLCRIITVDGPQVGDFNVWNRHDAGERFWAARTRQLQRAHVSTYDRLWSCLPFLRPLLTITKDTLAGYSPGGDGGRVHDLLGTHCDLYVNRLLTGRVLDDQCHANLVRAVRPYGLTEFDVHDVLGVFHCTGLNKHDQYVMKECPARPGDYLEFFAELDLLCALSTCPGGDMSVPMWGPYAHAPVEGCRPIAIVVYAVDDALLEGWTPPPQRAAHSNPGGVGLRSWL
ncbi:urea carboxylase-associated family protein [Streptomyces formicae]|uniref:urea carboxylase-associated family protein n=1 Tax=Streptomyces formicae TaxID=1616117 RepID=UPI001F5708C7|nr:urea carboxylase-associated family protein [Streptomyces formicae]